jgi:hypothetical protein
VLRRFSIFYMKPILLILSFLSLSAAVAAQNNNTLTGYIKDKKSRESLPGAGVRCGPNITFTNNYGFFSLSLPSANPGDTVFFFAIGYNDTGILFGALQTNQPIDIQLEESSIQLKNVEISTERILLPAGLEKLSKKQIQALPSLLGEKDAMKVIQLLPGVQRGNEGNSGLYVRGGSPDQNLVILDDAPVYNLSHFFGLFSVFNGDAIKSLNFYKGNIPARYGGRLSSVLDVTMQDGNKSEWKGEGGIGLLSSRFVLNGPLKREKSSILLAARRSYFDLLFSPLLQASNGVGLGYYFQDYNLKVNYQVNPRNYLLLSGYFGKDRFKFSEATSIKKIRNYNRFYWGNSTATLRWNHLGLRNSFVHTALIINKYQFTVDFKNLKAQDADRILSVYSKSSSGIIDMTLKNDWFWTISKHEIRTGGMMQQHLFTPAQINFQNDLAPIQNFNFKEQIKAWEGAIYAEDHWKINPSFSTDFGLRAYVMHYENTTKLFPEPRINISYKRPDLPLFQIGYTRTNQFLQLLSNSGISLPTDFWVPSTKEIHPQQADQLSLGAKGSFHEHVYNWSIELYYKQMRNISAYREGSSFIDFSDPTNATPRLVPWRDIILQGSGNAKGLEVLLEKKLGSLTGWLAYTLSKTTHQFAEINNGKAFTPFFDRRHSLNLTAIYKPNPRRTFAVIWVYASPNPVPVPVRTLPVLIDGAIQYVPYYGNRGSIRERNYHRLDLSVQFHKQKKRYLRTWEIGVYNVYNRKNPFYYNLSQKEQASGQSILQVEARSFFMFIPNIAYNFSF